MINFAKLTAEKVVAERVIAEKIAFDKAVAERMAVERAAEKATKTAPTVCKSYSDIKEEIKKNNNFLLAPEIGWFSFSYMNMGVEGARLFAPSLKGNKTLTTLIMEDNSFGDEGARFIAKALKKNNTLTTITLGGK
eukprot:TRINITY_DN423_c0_g1_i1.p1 TRINITY_DN423_c0_g1~~TRINITY_DN423_c0_g1_i1.p1  ORF type:complete len:136 (+),score=31.09 TRINITY_DN423_c0_g1_i1:1093-1500(+)